MSQILREQTFPLGRKLQIVQGDITQEQVDAIVNAANANLQHGGGVAGIIVRKGGWEIQAESTKWVRERGPVSHSEPAYTTAGSLPLKFVIHAVGPRWGEGDEDVKLAAAVQGALRVADKLELISIALPAISTGIFGFPKERAAKIIFDSIAQFFVDNRESVVEQVRLTLFDQKTIDVFLEIWDSETQEPGS